MRIISFDTSSNTVYLALLDHGTVVHEVAVAGNPADRKDVGGILMPQIDQAVRSAGWAKSDIDLVVVGVGPGSFTGIRVSVITAKTLAQVLNIGLVGVSLLETMFFTMPPAGQSAVVVSTTSNQFFYGAYCRLAEEPVSAVIPAGCGSLDAVLAAIKDSQLWFGDEKFVSSVNSVDSRAQVIPVIKNIASAQAQLASDRLSLRGLSAERREDKLKLAETFPWQDVLPLYLRSPSVTVKKSNAT